MGLLNRLAVIISLPALLYGWVVTANDAYFTFFSILVIATMLGIMAILLHIGLLTAQRKFWRSPMIVKMLYQYYFLTAISWVVNLSMAAFCFYNEKFVMGWFVLANLSMFMLFRYIFLVNGNVIIVPKESEALDAKSMLNEFAKKTKK